MVDGANMLANIYMQGGAMVIIAICFVGLGVWVVNTSAKREDRLYRIIETLSEKLEVLPHIKEELAAIKDELRGGKK